MKATIIGGGPAGLYTAIGLARDCNYEVRVIERYKEKESPGLGITIAENVIKGLAFIAGDKILQQYSHEFTEPFVGIDAYVGNLRKRSKKTFPVWGVKRSAVINMLRAACKAHGVKIEFGRDVTEEDVKKEKDRCDLLVGADGINSVVRNAYKTQFDPKEAVAKTPYIWLEVNGVFPHFVFAHIPQGDGLFAMSAYPHSRNSSSAVIEFSAPKLEGIEALLEDKDGITSRGLESLNKIFENQLRSFNGRLKSERSRWRYFKHVACRNYSHENVVLIGDAHTNVHFMNGSGTTDALAFAGYLVGSIEMNKELGKSFQVFGSMMADRTKMTKKWTQAHLGKRDSLWNTHRMLGPERFLQIDCDAVV